MEVYCIQPPMQPCGFPRGGRKANYILTLAWGFPALLVSANWAMLEPLHVERATRGSTFLLMY